MSVMVLPEIEEATEETSTEPEANKRRPTALLPKPGLLEWLLLLPFCTFFLLVLVVFDLAQRIAHPFGIKWLERMVAALNSSVVCSLRILGTKLLIVGRRDFVPDKPYIIVSNHQSMFDISIIHRTFAAMRPRFVAKKELGKWIPGISYCLRHEGSALIDRKNRNQSIREIIKFGKRMKEQNFAAVLFPEGTRARDGSLKAFRPAGFSMLLRTVPDADVIPVAVDGSWKFSARKFGPLPVGVTIHLRVGPLLKRDGKTDEELLDAVYKSVSEMLDQIRQADDCF